MQAWNVYLNGEYLDTVFFLPRHDAQDVCNSLVNHDGFDAAIIVEQRNTYGTL